MSNDVRYTAAKAREVENARLVWLDGSLREEAAQTVEENLAALRLDAAGEDRLGFVEADLDEWVARHANLVERAATRAVGDASCAHTFGLRKVAKGITRREDEERHGQWLVAPCSCGREFLVAGS